MPLDRGKTERVVIRLNYALTAAIATFPQQKRYAYHDHQYRQNVYPVNSHTVYSGQCDVVAALAPRNCSPCGSSSWMNFTAFTPYCRSRRYSLLRSIPSAAAART